MSSGPEMAGLNWLTWLENFLVYFLPADTRDTKMFLVTLPRSRHILPTGAQHW